MVKFIVFGFIQGLTEFLPVSSSGHLFILKRFLNSGQDLLPFFVLLHFATLLAIFVFFRQEIISTLFQYNVFSQIIIITAITAILGLVADRLLRNLFESRYWVSFFLLVNAGILLQSKKCSGTRECRSITLRDSFVLGVLQGLAVFPGISRSGITISGLLKRGFKPPEAFKLSFVMAIPVILGTSTFKLKALVTSDIPVSSLWAGFISAFLVGLLALAILRKTLLKRNFNQFGYYCVAISFLSLILHG